uniref:RxLR effector candidate protein n=1 Tax=Hyaloperonospora arabidopsidis (strain Emoy2) TaxID=559515 RepID=M4BG60_HYAAE
MDILNLVAVRDFNFSVAHMEALNATITSQFAPSGNNGQATKTSKEPGDRPPYPGWEVPYRGAQINGGGLLAAACATDAAQRANRKGSNNPDTPR